MRILVILSRVPWPLEKGDKLRAYHLIKSLAENNEVFLFCLADKRVHVDAEQKLKEFCSEVFIHRLSRIGLITRLAQSFFNHDPFQVNYFNSGSAQKALRGFLEAHIPQHIYCQLIRTAEYAIPYSTIPKTMDYMDALSIGMNRMASAAKWPVNLLMRFEENRLKEYEHRIYEKFDVHTIISEQDADAMGLSGKVTIIPNGIDERFFKPRQTSKTRDILFTGNMMYRPNVESARYLVKEIMPLVWEKRPELKVTLAGANPAAQIKALASNRVEVTGWVDDIIEVYQSSRIFAAPMLINSGMQNKLLEAMASGLPCITTSLANNAIGTKPNQHIFIGDTAQDFADHILELSEKKDLSSEIGLAGKEFVQKNYSWNTEAERLQNLMFEPKPSFQPTS